MHGGRKLTLVDKRCQRSGSAWCDRQVQARDPQSRWCNDRADDPQQTRSDKRKRGQTLLCANRSASFRRPPRGTPGIHEISGSPSSSLHALHGASRDVCGCRRCGGSDYSCENVGASFRPACQSGMSSHVPGDRARLRRGPAGAGLRRSRLLDATRERPDRGCPGERSRPQRGMSLRMEKPRRRPLWARPDSPSCMNTWSTSAAEQAP